MDTIEILNERLANLKHFVLAGSATGEEERGVPRLELDIRLLTLANEYGVEDAIRVLEQAGKVDKERALKIAKNFNLYRIGYRCVRDSKPRSKP